MNSTLLSFPNRGPWGDNRYRGNCSGYIYKAVIEQYRVKSLGEVFAGSGTGSDVCRDMNIPYLGLELNANSVRDDIIGGFDALVDDIPDAFYGRELTFMHPPYGAEIGIPYAGSQWDTKSFLALKGYDPTKADLGQMPWKKFMESLNFIVMKFFSAMDKGSRMAILMGDVKRNGVLYSMLCDIVKPGNLEQIIIKAEHNCFSDAQVYSNRNFVPIKHEYLMILKKVLPYVMDFNLPKNYEIDIRDSKDATWNDVVRAVLLDIGKEATLSEIYEKIEGHKKCETNKNWQAKVRQTLQKGNFKHVENGVWAAA